MMDEKDDESFNVVNLPSEIEKSNFIGRFIYSWQWRFYYRNHNKLIKLKDIPKRRKEDDANRIYNDFEKQVIYLHLKRYLLSNESLILLDFGQMKNRTLKKINENQIFFGQSCVNMVFYV